MRNIYSGDETPELILFVYIFDWRSPTSAESQLGASIFYFIYIWIIPRSRPVHGDSRVTDHTRLIQIESAHKSQTECTSDLTLVFEI